MVPVKAIAIVTATVVDLMAASSCRLDNKRGGGLPMFLFS
jgi:hypothetical protein